GTDLNVPLKELRSHLLDGAQVEKVDLALPLPHWPQGAVLLDTPGIDSTEDAHRMATESALHLADVVLYVTDYNHVQSEVNFHFTKMLQEQGKSVVWIINQVDKHQEWEIPFASYREQIEASFRDWGLDLMTLYFTSLTDKHHPYNEFPQLKQLL